MFRIRFALLYALLLVLIACSAPRYYSIPGDNVYLLADYKDAIELWTAHDEGHHNLIGVADLNAVYRSWEVRQAFIQLVKNRWMPANEIIDRVISRETSGFEKGHEFLLGLYCFDEAWQRMTGIDPVWHLRLCSDTADPVDVELIEKIDPKAEEAWMFLPDITHGRSVYRAIFPKTDAQGRPVIDRQTRCFVLYCDSILCNLTLRWTIGSVPDQLR